MKPLVAELLAGDRRVAQARQLMLEALSEHQRQLTTVRPPDPEREISYAELIKNFSEMRGGALYYPYLGSGIGNGALVELLDGSIKYDMISGIGVHYWGHSHNRLAAAAFDAAVQDTIMQGNLQQNEQAVNVSRDLISSAMARGARLSHCFLSSSGAMANENALKLMFQKKRPAGRILAFEGAFAGRTLVLSQTTDKPSFRDGLPPTVAVDYVPFFDSQYPRESTDRAINVLKSHLTRYPKQHAMMCMELVQGEGGFNVGDRQFFIALMELLKANNVAIWVDEVQTFGRTEELFAFQTFGLDSYVDVVTIGKLLQVCATLFTDEFRPQPGLVSQTFIASSSALLAAEVILDDLHKGGYFGSDGRIAKLHAHFAGQLQAIAQRHPRWISGPWGIGAMIAFTPFDGNEGRDQKILQALFKAGVIAFVAGDKPARIRFLPPAGVVSERDIDAVCAILEKTLADFADALRENC